MRTGADRGRASRPTAATDAARVLSELGLTEVILAERRRSGHARAGGAREDRRRLVNDGVPVLGFAVQRPSLEDVFVSLTGEGFDVSG